jgi:hypothetical protein
MERKYFVPYVAYRDCDTYHPLLFNKIIYIDEPITTKLISDIEDDLVKCLEEDEDFGRHFWNVQIQNFTLLND